MLLIGSVTCCYNQKIIQTHTGFLYYLLKVLLIKIFDDMSTKIQMLKADIGDAFIIEVAEGERTFTMVVDGGPRASLPTVKKAFESLEHVDLMVLTHYDSDHIKGILEYLTTRPDQVSKIDKFWLNCPHIPVRLGTKASAGEMKQLRDFFESIDSEENPIDWRDNVVQGFTYDSPNGLVHLEVITPTEDAKRLNEAFYDKELGRRKASCQIAKRVQEDFDTELKVLAESDPRGKYQVVNNSSISFLMTINTEDKQHILMLGDVMSDDVYTYLSKTYSKDEKLELDALKVPHHGSRFNLTSQLLEIIDCSKYLISTAGGAEVADDKTPLYNHPDRVTIAKILLHEGRDLSKKISLYFNYALDSMQERGALVLHKEEIEDENLNFEVIEEAPEIWI